MDRDAESQPTEHDKEFIKLYKLIHLANDRAAYTASKTLNSRLSEPEIKEYINELHKNFVKMSKVIKNYRDKIANVDNEVVLNNHRTYPNYFDLLTPENQRKIHLFEKSVDDFEDGYKMVNELYKLNKSPSPRTPRTSRTSPRVPSIPPPRTSIRAPPMPPPRAPPRTQRRSGGKRRKSRRPKSLK